MHPPRERPKLEASRNQLVWDNGTIAQMFAADDPDSLRGPQFDAAWCDELCKWRRPDYAWDMLQFALRLGALAAVRGHHHAAAIPLLKRIMDDHATAISRSRTADNANFLAPPSWPRCSAATATRRSAARSSRARSWRSA